MYPGPHRYFKAQGFKSHENKVQLAFAAVVLKLWDHKIIPILKFTHSTKLFLLTFI